MKIKIVIKMQNRSFFTSTLSLLEPTMYFTYKDQWVDRSFTLTWNPLANPNKAHTFSRADGQCLAHTTAFFKHWTPQCSFQLIRGQSRSVWSVTAPAIPEIWGTEPVSEQSRVTWAAALRSEVCSLSWAWGYKGLRRVNHPWGATVPLRETRHPLKEWLNIELICPGARSADPGPLQRSERRVDVSGREWNVSCK